MATNNPFTDTQNDSDSGGWMLVAGFFVFVLGSFIILEIGLIPESARLIVLAFLFIVLPLLLGLSNAIQGYTYSSSLAVGVSPLVAWLIVTIGRVLVGAIEINPVVWFGIAIGITVAGLFAALGGFAIGYIGQIAATKYAES
jgi:hypothetical protein